MSLQVWSWVFFVLYCLGMLGLGVGGGAMDIGSILGSVASGGVGGGVLMAIVGAIKGAMAKS